MGGFLVRKLVKQTKAYSWLAQQADIDQFSLVEAMPDERTRRARILRKSDTTLRQEQARLNPADSIFDQGLKVVSLFACDCGSEILNFDRALTSMAARVSFSCQPSR
jgi:hypothetical protein